MVSIPGAKEVSETLGQTNIDALAEAKADIYLFFLQVAERALVPDIGEEDIRRFALAMADVWLENHKGIGFRLALEKQNASKALQR